MLQPKRTKYRKMQKGRIKGLAHRGSQIAWGTWGLKVLEPARITARQLEAVRVAITRTMERKGSVWLRVFPDKVLTKKPAEVRMGKGKGAPDRWVAPVKPGRILFEIDGVSQEVAAKAIRLAGYKLPVKSKLFTRRDYKEA